MIKSSNNIKGKGFTIVELLVVIVVIGILAAITIVSYTGITGRANAAAGQAAAESVLDKVNVYQTDKSQWPITFTEAIKATTSSGALTGVTQAATLLAAAPTKPQTINYYICGTKDATTAAAAVGDIPATFSTGVQVKYWKADTNAVSSVMETGTTSGTTAASTATIACFIVAS